MMSVNTQLKTPLSLHRTGINALVKELGAVDAVRFIRLFDNGYGDYTKERHDTFDNMSVDDIFADMKKQEA